MWLRAIRQTLDEILEFLREDLAQGVAGEGGGGRGGKDEEDGAGDVWQGGGGDPGVVVGFVGRGGGGGQGLGCGSLVVGIAFPLFGRLFIAL